MHWAKTRAFFVVCVGWGGGIAPLPTSMAIHYILYLHCFRCGDRSFTNCLTKVLSFLM